jgi:hypothetical protein
MMWAVDVPAFMIHAPPCAGLSGKPVDCVVARRSFSSGSDDLALEITNDRGREPR